MIDEYWREKFIRKIFSHNAEQYTTTLTQLDDVQSWQEASVLLDRVFVSLGIDQGMPIAQKLRAVVYNRYVQHRQVHRGV